MVPAVKRMTTRDRQRR